MRVSVVYREYMNLVGSFITLAVLSRALSPPRGEFILIVCKYDLSIVFFRLQSFR